MEWVSAHIFYSGDHDLLLAELVAPFISNNRHLLAEPSPYFFIRYWEGGEHIRLRLHCDSRTLLEKEMINQAADFFKQYPAHRAEKEIQNGALYPDNSVQFISYIPETERYGNARSLPWAEEYFAASSALILHWISDAKNKNTRFIQALKLHLILIQACGFNDEQIDELCEGFIDDWLSRLCSLFNDMAAEKQLWLQQFEVSFEPQKQQSTVAVANFWQQIIYQKLPDELYQFNALNQRIMRQYQNEGVSGVKILDIIKSLMHMNHNRLGISNQEESYVVYCTHQCLLKMMTST
jgi:thiopeptide-type bacteriocin biosynthesis protein